VPSGGHPRIEYFFRSAYTESRTTTPSRSGLPRSGAEALRGGVGIVLVGESIMGDSVRAMFNETGIDWYAPRPREF